MSSTLDPFQMNQLASHTIDFMLQHTSTITPASTVPLVAGRVIGTFEYSKVAFNQSRSFSIKQNKIIFASTTPQSPALRIYWLNVLATAQTFNDVFAMVGLDDIEGYTDILSGDWVSMDANHNMAIINDSLDMSTKENSTNLWGVVVANANLTLLSPDSIRILSSVYYR